MVSQHTANVPRGNTRLGSIPKLSAIFKTSRSSLAAWSHPAASLHLNPNIRW